MPPRCDSLDGPIARRPTVEVDELAILLELEGIALASATEFRAGMAASPLASVMTEVEKARGG